MAVASRSRRRRARSRQRPIGFEPLEQRRLLTHYNLNLQGGSESFGTFDLVAGADFDRFSMIHNATSETGDHVSIQFNPNFADLDLYLQDSLGNTWSSVSGVNTGVEQIPLAGLAPGPYTATVRVRGLYPGAVGFYNLLLETARPVAIDAIDQLFPNNTSGNATSLNSAQGNLQGTQQVQGTVHFTAAGGSDLDWYRFRSVATGAPDSSIVLDFAHPRGDLDVWLYSAADLANPIAASTSTTNDEFISLHTLLPGDYFLAVAGKSVGGNLRHTNPAYTLTVRLPSAPSPDDWENNDSLVQANNLGVINAFFQVSNGTIDRANDDDFFAFEIASPGTSDHGLILDHNRGLGDLNVAIRDASGELLRWTTSTTNVKTLSLQGLPAGRYFAQVYGNGNTNPGYTLSFLTPVAPDVLEFESPLHNDSIFYPSNLGALQGTGSITDLTVHLPHNDDWYRLQMLNTGQAGDVVRIDFDDALGDLGIALYDANGNLVGFANSTTDDFEGVLMQGAPPGVYYVQVYGNGATNPNYTLSWDLPAPPPADAFESNDVWANRAPLGTLSGVHEYPALSLHLPGDNDWFEFQLGAAAGGGNYVQVDFDHYRGNVDLALYDAAGNPLAWSFGYGNGERVSMAGLPAGTYYLWVGSQFAHTNPDYSLTIDAPQAATPDFTEASPPPWDLGQRSGQSTVEDLSIHAANDIDWFTFELTAEAAARHRIRLEHNEQLGRLDAVLFDAQGVFLNQASVAGAADEIPLRGLAAGHYVLGVFGSNGATNPAYQLLFDAPGGNLGGDYLEANDTSGTATDLGVLRGLRTWADPDRPLSVHENDQDWFRFELKEAATTGHAVGILFDQQLGDLDLALYAEAAAGGQAGTTLAVSEGTKNLEEISLAGLDAGIYYLRVRGYQDSTNPEYALLINAPGADRLEPNDERARATNLSTSLVTDEGGQRTLAVRGLRSWQGLSLDQVDGADEDWFQIALAADAGTNHYASIQFSHALGNLDLELLDNQGNVLEQSRSVSDHERVSLAGLTAAAGPYYLRVAGSAGAGNPLYNLTVNAPEPLVADHYEANDSRGAATDLGMIRGPRVLSDADLPLSIEQDDSDWFRFETDAASRPGHFVGIFFQHADGDLDLELYDADGTLLEQSAGVGDSHTISLAELPAGTYFARVSGFDGATNPRYGLAINTPGANTQDWSEPNNTTSDAHDLGTIHARRSLTNLSIHDADDIDLFTFELPETGAAGHFVTLRFNHLLGDLDLRLVDGGGRRWESQSAGDNETISLTGLPPGEYRVEVRGEANPRYSLLIAAPESPEGDFAEQHGLAEDNDAQSRAFDLRTVSGAQVLEPLSIHQATDEDWFRFNFAAGLTAGAGDFLAVVFDPALGDLDIELYDADGNPVLDAAGDPRQSRTADGVERIALGGLAADDGPYFLRVHGHNGAVNPFYSLILQAPDRNLAADWAESNDQATQAQDLRVVEGGQGWSGLSLHDAADEDWFRFDLLEGTTGTESHAVRVLFDHAEGNVDLALYASDDLDTPRFVSANISNREEISLAGLRSDQGPFYVRVSGDASPGYRLEIDAPRKLTGDWAETFSGEENNNARERAVNLREVEAPLVLDRLSIDPSGDADFFRFVTTSEADAAHFVRIDFRHAEGNLKLALLDQNGQTVDSVDTSRDGERLSLDGLAAGEYFVRVEAAEQGGTNPLYRLTIAPPGSLEHDFAEANDTPQQAFDLRSLANTARQRSGLGGFNGSVLGLFIPPLGGVADIPTAGINPNNLSAAFSNPLTTIPNLAAATQFGVNNPLLVHSTPLSIPNLNPASQQSLNIINQESANFLNFGTIGGSALNAITNPNNGLNPAFNQLAQTGFGFPFNPNATASSLINFGGGGGFNPLAGLNPFGPTGGFPAAGLGGLGGLGFAGFGGQSFGGNPFAAFDQQFGALSGMIGATGLLGGGGGSPAFNFLSGIGAFRSLRADGGLEARVAVAGLSLHDDNDTDWFRLELADDADRDQFARVLAEREENDWRLRLFSDRILDDPLTSPLDEVSGDGRILELSLANLIAGVYYLEVTGTALPAYALEVAATPPATVDVDWAEDNDRLADATDLRAVEGTRLLDGLSIDEAVDEDWFRFETRGAAVDGHFVRIDFSGQHADLDLALYRPDGTLIDRSEGTDGRETISLDGLEAGTYLAHVYAYGSRGRGEYVLSLSTPQVTVAPDALEPNNDRQTAANLSTVSGVDRITNQTIHAGDTDYFRFTTAATGTAASHVSIRFEHDQGDLQLELQTAGGGFLDASRGTGDQELISLVDLPAGDYVVRVTGADAGTTNRYQLTIDAPTEQDADPRVDDWTIMVYMTAADLEEFAFEDINQMELAASQLPGSVNIAVLLDQTAGVITDQLGRTRSGLRFPTGSQPAWDDVGRALITADTDPRVVATEFERLGEQNTGDPATLVDFVEWAVAAAPAERYALVLWDHGSGVAGSNDDVDSGHDRLRSPELSAALDDLASTVRLDVLSFDACLMAMAEVADSLAGRVDILVASQENEGGPGYDYRTAFASLLSNPATVTPRQFAYGVVLSYQNQYVGRVANGTDTHSAIDLRQLSHLNQALRQFVDEALNFGSETDWTRIRQAIENVPSYGGQFNVTRDLGRFMQNIAGRVTQATIAARALEVVAALRDSVLARTTDFRQSQGLAIFLPRPEQGRLYQQLRGDYVRDHAAFVAETGWDRFLDAFVDGSLFGFNLHPDWAGRNFTASRAFNLHALSGANHQYEGLRLEPGQQDWHRFTIHETAAAGDQVAIQYDPATGPLHLALFAATDPNVMIDESREGNGSESVGMSGLAAGEYLIQVRSAAQQPSDYHLSITAPTAEQLEADWAAGNDRPEKAYSLGVIAADTTLSGLSVDAAADDWFSFSTPRLEAPADRQIRIASPSGEALRAELFDGQGNSIDAGSGAAITLQYASGGGLEYQLQIATTSELSAVPYSIQLIMDRVNTAATAILLDDLTVAEASLGAVVGGLTVVDAEDDPHTFTLSDDRFEVAGGQLKLKADVSLSYQTEPSLTLDVTAADAGDASLRITRSFEIEVLPRGPLWQNPQLRQDVTGDGIVAPVDVLAVVNYINSNGSGPVPTDRTPPPYYDVSGDNLITPVDVVAVVNYLNSRGAGGQNGAAGESARSTPRVCTPLEPAVSRQQGGFFNAELDPLIDLLAHDQAQRRDRWEGIGPAVGSR